MISYWHRFGPLLSGHPGPILLKSFDVNLPHVARLTFQFLLPVPVLHNSLPPDLAFSSSEFELVSFHAPRKEVKEKHSALDSKAWVHISSHQNVQIYIWRAFLQHFTSEEQIQHCICFPNRSYFSLPSFFLKAAIPSIQPLPSSSETEQHRYVRCSCSHPAFCSPLN